MLTKQIKLSKFLLEILLTKTSYWLAKNIGRKWTRVVGGVSHECRNKVQRRAFFRAKKGSSRNPGKHRNKNADLIDDVRASKHI
jgi:hypothetical protein